MSSGFFTPPPQARKVARPQSPVTIEKNNDAENVGQLNTRLERYLIKVRDLAKQNEDLKAKLAKLKGKNPGAATPPDNQSKEKLDALAAEKKELEKAVSDLDRKNGEKKKAVDNLRKENEGNAEELAQKEKDILALNQAIGHLQDRPKVADPQRFNEIALLKEKIKEKEAEIKKMKENAQEDFEKALENEKLIWKTHEDDVKKELADHYSKKTKELDDKIQKLRDQLELLKKAKDQEQATLNSLNDRLERLRRERAGLILELDKKKDDTLNQLNLAVQERSQEVDSLKGLVAEKQDELREIERQSVEFKDEIRKYEEILEDEERRFDQRKRRPEAPKYNPPFEVNVPATTAEQGPQEEEEVKVTFRPKQRGKVSIKEITPQAFTLLHNESFEIDMTGWSFRVQPSGNPSKFQKFNFRECLLVPGVPLHIDISQLQTDQHRGFDVSQCGPGSVIKLLDESGDVVTEIEVTEGLHKVGNFDRVCVAM